MPLTEGDFDRIQQQDGASVLYVDPLCKASTSITFLGSPLSVFRPTPGLSSERVAIADVKVKDSSEVISYLDLSIARILDAQRTSFA